MLFLDGVCFLGDGGAFFIGEAPPIGLGVSGDSILTRFVGESGVTDRRRLFGAIEDFGVCCFANDALIPSFLSSMGCMKAGESWPTFPTSGGTVSYIKGYISK